MKRFISVILCMLLLFSLSSASAAKKSKSTPTPEPVDIGTDLVNPPEKIQQMLEIAYQEWVSVNGKDQGKKNKYTKWFNNYEWGRNSWCAGFVTWCMLEAGIPQMPKDEILELEEGVVPESVFHVKASSPGKMLPGYLHLHRTTKIPQRGFIVDYGTGSNKYVHVGIVYDVEDRGNGIYRLTCIEGAMRNTVRMFVYDYDSNAEMKKNTSTIPKEERTQEESKIFTYKPHVSGQKYYINCFFMPWLPGDEDL